LGGFLTWSPSNKTTKISKVTIVATGTCPAGSRAFEVLTSVVAGGTATYTKAGDKGLFPLCQASTGQITMQAGKKALI
jgi:hypothetical protein